MNWADRIDDLITAAERFVIAFERLVTAVEADIYDREPDPPETRNYE
jgi:hypothetical protein